MTNKKMTKKDYFNALLTIAEVQENVTLVEFINHEIELLTKKNVNRTSKQTANQKANEGIKVEILANLAKAENQLFTISEMQKNFECCAELSNQRISAIVRQLVSDNKVERIEEKRKAYFRIVK